MLTKPVQIQKLGGGSGGLVLEATLGGEAVRRKENMSENVLPTEKEEKPE